MISAPSLTRFGRTAVHSTQRNTFAILIKTNPRNTHPKVDTAPIREGFHRVFSSASSGKDAKEGVWHSAKFWGTLGAIAGWGMSGAAIYDAINGSPEIISMNMTSVLIVYSSLFARWAYIVTPQNLLLCSCHVTNVVAQINQLRRSLEYKLSQGKDDEVEQFLKSAAVAGMGGALCLVAGPMARKALMASQVGLVASMAASEAGPFTVHFWAPMSKWLISGASFMDLNRPTDKISIAQYSALTLTGAFFSRYALLVRPVNYMLCSVNIALFGSSAWHLGRKINADFIETKKE